MQPGKPVGHKFVPTRYHGQPRTGAEVDAERCRVVHEKQNNRQRHNEAREPEAAQPQAESLGDGANHVHRVARNERKYRTGGEDVDERDERRRYQDRASEIPRRIAALSRKNCDILEAAQRAEHHLGEHAETKDRQRRHGQPKGVIFRKCSAQPVEQRSSDEQRERD